MQLLTKKKHLYIFFLVQLFFLFLFIFTYFTPHRIMHLQIIQRKSSCFLLFCQIFLFFLSFFSFLLLCVGMAFHNVCLLEHKHRRGSRPPAHSHSPQPPCLIHFIFNHPNRASWLVVDLPPLKQGFGEGGTGGKLEDEEKRDRKRVRCTAGTSPHQDQSGK